MYNSYSHDRLDAGITRYIIMLQLEANKILIYVIIVHYYIMNENIYSLCKYISDKYTWRDKYKTLINIHIYLYKVLLILILQYVFGTYCKHITSS